MFSFLHYTERVPLDLCTALPCHTPDIVYCQGQQPNKPGFLSKAWFRVWWLRWEADRVLKESYLLYTDPKHVLDALPAEGLQLAWHLQETGKYPGGVLFARMPEDVVTYQADRALQAMWELQRELLTALGHPQLLAGMPPVSPPLSIRMELNRLASRTQDWLLIVAWPTITSAQQTVQLEEVLSKLVLPYSAPLLVATTKVPAAEQDVEKMLAPILQAEEQQAAEALRQLSYLSPRRPLPLALLQLLPGNHWNPDICDMLVKRQLLRRTMGQADLYDMPAHVRDALIRTAESQSQPLELKELEGTGWGRQLAALLLMYGSGSAVKWALSELKLQPFLRSSLSDPTAPLLWDALPLGVKQWAAAGLPGLNELQGPAVDVLVGIMLKGFPRMYQAAKACFKRVTDSGETAASDHPMAYFTAVRELVGRALRQLLVSSISDAELQEAKYLCEQALQWLQQQQQQPQQQQLQRQQPQPQPQDPKWAADWVWLKVQHVKLQQRTSGAGSAEAAAEAVRELQLLLDSLQQGTHPHLVGYCHLSLADALLARGGADAVREAGEQINTGLALADKSAECSCVWLHDGAATQLGPQLALKALCLLARLKQAAAAFGLQLPDQPDTKAVAEQANEACCSAFGCTSPEAQEAEELKRRLADRQRAEKDYEYMQLIEADVQAAAAEVLLKPGLLDLVTEAELQARESTSTDDEWLPGAPGSRARSKACKQLQELREAIETNGFHVDAVQLDTFFNLPFSMERTTGFGEGSAAAAKAEDEAKQRELAAKTAAASVKLALQELVAGNDKDIPTAAAPAPSPAPAEPAATAAAGGAAAAAAPAAATAAAGGAAAAAAAPEAAAAAGGAAAAAAPEAAAAAGGAAAPAAPAAAAPSSSSAGARAGPSRSSLLYQLGAEFRAGWDNV